MKLELLGLSGIRNYVQLRNYEISLPWKTRPSTSVASDILNIGTLLFYCSNSSIWKDSICKFICFNQKAHTVLSICETTCSLILCMFLLAPVKNTMLQNEILSHRNNWVIIQLLYKVQFSSAQLVLHVALYFMVSKFN